MLSLSMKSSMLLCLKKLVLIEQCMCQVLLQPSRSELLRRLQERIKIGGHFMPASLLESQLATLEPEGKNIIAIQGPHCCHSLWPTERLINLTCLHSQLACI